MEATAEVIVMPAPEPVTLVPALPRSQTLYDIETTLAALLDSEECIEPEQEEEFNRELSAALTAAVEKRDRVAQFLAHVENQQDLAAKEIERLKGRKSYYAAVQARMEHIVIHTIQEIGKDAKGKYKSLEGRTSTLKLAKNPPSVEVTNEAAVPQEYKTATITIPAQTWDFILDSLDMDVRDHVVDALQAKYTVAKAPIAKALKANTEVPGAKLAEESYRLERA